MYKRNYTIEGRIVDVKHDRIFEGAITIEGDFIKKVEEKSVENKQYIIPGLIDAHVHIESSMLVPSEFARLAVVHGTVGTVSDPHEIANVNGMEGIEFMLRNAEKVPFHFHFGAPSCVPATAHETSGAVLDPEKVEQLLKDDRIGYLSEMMNFPGVLNNDPDVFAKIKAAQDAGKPVDGHAPGLKGEQARKYAEAGIQTDHECFTIEEARDKLKAGMYIAIREGSAAKNFDALYPLIEEWPDKIMFCSDDKHPDDLIKGHINSLIKRSIANGTEPMTALKAATLNPVNFYNLPTGLLQEGDPATFVVIDDLEKFNIQQTFIKGEKLAENGKSAMKNLPEWPVNNFNCEPVSEEQLELFAREQFANVINVEDGQLMTGSSVENIKLQSNNAISDTDRDILKLFVVNRYQKAPVSQGFVKNIGIKEGAIASSIAHDSHNIIATGSTDKYVKEAINLVIEQQGGIAVVHKDQSKVLPLPVAGLMTTEDGYEIAARYEELDKMAKDAGATLSAPFMTLSFLALLVIPHLKLGDKGLFDVNKFEFVPLFYSNSSDINSKQDSLSET